MSFRRSRELGPVGAGHLHPVWSRRSWHHRRQRREPRDPHGPDTEDRADHRLPDRQRRVRRHQSL